MYEKEERDSDTEVPENENYTEEGSVDIIRAGVMLQHNGQMVKAKIMKQIIRPDGDPIDKYNQNPILYSLKYEVELPNGVVYKC